MKINTTTGLLEDVTHVASPNCDERPDASEMDLVVIHNISLPPGQFGGPWIDALFTNTLDPKAHPYFAEIHQLHVSSHILIRRDGKITQYVPFHKRAWHAGKSQYQSRERCNDFSIGIELEGCDEQNYQDAQYSQLAHLIDTLCTTYPTLSTQRLTGHCDIAPGRKTDPGPAFDWHRLHKLLGLTP